MESLGPILVVEDEPALCAFLTEVLASRYTVECAGTAEAAFQFIAHSPPALVLCDVSLPNVSGLELLAQLRGNPVTAQIPVILMSGSQDEVEALAHKAGAVAFLPKPFQIPQVLSSVSAFAARPCRVA
jgi:CheY-like chemotaxis protein